VDIEGYVTAYSYRNEVWGRQSYVQYFVAEKIELSKTQLEEAFPEECAGQGFAHNDAFINVSLMGEIVRISRSEAQNQEGSDKPRVWTKIMLRVEPAKDDHRPSLVNVQYSSNMRVSDTPIHVGDKVCMTALVSSKRKNTGYQTESNARRNSSRRNIRNFEDIIVNDLAVIEHAQPETDPAEVEKILSESEAETTAVQDTVAAEDSEGSFFAGVETE
jgi:flagella basal body P-ring formation protein FlgA